jgi:ABC-2 type transport system ATP-binding protein
VPEPVISVVGLRKRYGELEAVRGIDLEVERGEVFAFLGPNGAGKTTTVEILEGYRERTAGEVSVLDRDPAEPSRDWRERLGLVLQSCNLQPELTVREAVELYAGYYRRPRAVGETIALVGLQGSSDVRTSKLSGGQQRRLDVGLALIGDPELLFLDEPTTGFDPSARRQAWQVIESLRELGKTIFLTTHYMDEAQRLADRVAIISGGEIVAQGTPGEIGGRARQATRITFRLPEGIGPAELPTASAQHDGDLVRIDTGSPVELLNQLTDWALKRRIDIEELEVRRPSLEDVYLQLTDEEL